MVVCVQPPTGSRSGSLWKADLRVLGLGERMPWQPCSSIVGWTVYVVGVWPLRSRTAWGPPGCEKRFFYAGPSAEEQRVCPLWAHLLNVPAGPASGAQPRRFQNGIRSSAAAGRKRRGGKGRRPSLLGCFALGACLFLSLLRVQQAVSGCRRGGMPAAAGPGEGTSGTAFPSAQPGVSCQPLPSYCGD